jgi:DNA polymerase III subunit epsilon
VNDKSSALLNTHCVQFEAFDSLPWAKICFVDVETTGSAPPHAGVTEVAVVSYPIKKTAISPSAAGLDPPSEWSSLINPDRSIPHEIRFLTGISNEMVRNAPRFAQVVDHVENLLEGALFVAHHARFDFGFLKYEFERAGRPWPATIKTLCTVRLSRLLDADKSPHSLDAIRIRYRLPSTERHRALGDAKALQYFFEALCKKHGEAAVLLAIKRLMLMPSLPAHLPADSLTNIPHAPGVYLFFGENNHPLYIGKSIDLRARVASHFGQDHRSERGIRLSSEIRRIEHIETPDELCALIKEQQLIHELSPSHNLALRKKQNAVLVHFSDDIEFVAATDVSLGDLIEKSYFGPFSTKASAKKTLTEYAHSEQLCLPALGLERRTKKQMGQPCFARQVMRCRGACCNIVSTAEDLHLLQDALLPIKIDPAALTKEAWQLADGQWVQFSQIVPSGQFTSDPTWVNQKFNPSLYSILKKYKNSIKIRQHATHITVSTASVD